LVVEKEEKQGGFLRKMRGKREKTRGKVEKRERGRKS